MMRNDIETGEVSALESNVRSEDSGAGEQDSSRTRVHLYITGRVQGVGYRVSMQAEALRRVTTGWVRNTSTGAVEAEVEGERATVNAVVAWCQRGPAWARVDQVQVAEVPVRHDVGFHVLADA